MHLTCRCGNKFTIKSEQEDRCFALVCSCGRAYDVTADHSQALTPEKLAEMLSTDNVINVEPDKVS